MTRKALLFAGAGLLLLLPERLLAGGPPWLCLPVDGVTHANAQSCADLLGAKLAGQRWTAEPKQYNEVHVARREGQWYVTMAIKEDVRLSDVEAALKGSAFSVPREKLRLFGHVVLEFDAGETPNKSFLTDLEALECSTVFKTEEGEDGRLLVTMEMPYPTVNGEPQRATVGWDEFRGDVYASETGTRPESTKTPLALPSIDVIGKIAAGHKARVSDVRWNVDYWCRPLGGVAAPDSSADVGQAAPTVAGK